MKNGKFLVAIGLLLLSIMVSNNAMAGFGAITDFFFTSKRSATYVENVHERYVDSSYLYDKFSDYYCTEAFGVEVCGYDCRPGDTHASCAPTREGHCVENDYGVVTCGYGCVVHGQDMQCGSEYGERCVKDQLGRIACGQDCHCHNGSPWCKEPHYPSHHKAHHENKYHYGHHGRHHVRHDHGHHVATYEPHHYVEHDGHHHHQKPLDVHHRDTYYDRDDEAPLK